MLLQHTSGVFKPARFEPGTGWSYSNTNYILAA
jgi:CubicO group peptidase (beta-lactamase class C family)